MKPGRCPAHALVAISLAVWAGCAFPGKRLPAPAATLPDPQEVVAAFAERCKFVHSLKALAKLRYTDPNERYTSRQVIAVERPDRIRVEVTTMLGTAFVLAARDARLIAYWPEENTAFAGLATPDHVWRYTRVWMPLETLVDVLLAIPGSGRLEPTGCTHEETTDASPGYVCLHQARAGQGAVVVALDARGLPAEVEERSAVDGSVLWRARYLEYTENLAPPAAKHIVIDVPRYRRSVSLQLSEIEINPTLGRDVFRLGLPPGVRVVDLDEQEAGE